MPAPINISRHPEIAGDHIRCIVKRKNGRYEQLKALPADGSTYQFYIDEPVQMTTEELKVQLADQSKRWFTNERAAWELAKEAKANMTDDDKEHWVALQVLTTPDLFWVGRRFTMAPAKEAFLIISVGEMYLKAKVHKARMFRVVIDDICRIVGHKDVIRATDHMLEVRGKMPTEQQLDELSVIPGLAKIYRAAQKTPEGSYPKEGPFAELLRDCCGGLPVMKDQPALVLMSGGIDSPVAAYRMMARGCYVNGVHFLNSTNDTGSVMHKNRLIAKTLSRIQGQFTLKFVDISRLQTQIVAKIRPLNRTVMYKWFMLHIGTQLDDSFFIIVGDSVGQVASQTVHNIFGLYSTQTTKPVIAPLIGSHKTEIVHQAQRIGTYAPSIMEGADCCQYMMCKTGANLHIGKRTIRQNVRLISPCELPVVTERFRNGEFLDSTESVFSLNPVVLDDGNSQIATINNISEMRDRSRKVGAPKGRKNKVAPGEEGAAEDEAASGASSSASSSDDDEESRPVYFDAAGGTVPHPEVMRAMAKAPHGNPNSLHGAGRDARMAIEKVRADFAQRIGVASKDIIFTSGGTESNNIALNGYEVIRDVWSHPSTIGNLAKVNAAAAAAGAASPAMVSKGKVKVVDLVHHETGSINTNFTKPAGCDLLHVDAAQALTKIDWKRLDMSKVDSMTFVAHKFNGPSGVGVLYLKDAEKRLPLMFGGSQEAGVRPGSENVAAIVGMAAALRVDRTRSIHAEVEDYLVEQLTKLGCTVNRRGETSGYIVHATLPEGVHNVNFVTYLSATYGIEIGTGSACKTSDEENVSTYEFLGIEPAPVRRSIRLSYDFMVTHRDAERAIEGIKKALLHFRVNKTA